MVSYKSRVRFNFFSSSPNEVQLTALHNLPIALQVGDDLSQRPCKLGSDSDLKMVQAVSEEIAHQSPLLVHAPRRLQVQVLPAQVQGSNGETGQGFRCIDKYVCFEDSKGLERIFVSDDNIKRCVVSGRYTGRNSLRRDLTGTIAIFTKFDWTL